MLIPTHVLRAVSLAMAKNDEHDYLDGLLLYPVGRALASERAAVATDSEVAA